jgi:hypothetical protein
MRSVSRWACKNKSRINSPCNLSDVLTIGEYDWSCTLMLDLHIDHDRFGSSSDPSLNGRLHYPNNLYDPINEDVTTKIRQYHVDYNTRMTHGTVRGPHVRLCGELTSQPHVRCGILGTSSSRTFTTRAPHVWLCGEFTAQPHVVRYPCYNNRSSNSISFMFPIRH